MCAKSKLPLVMRGQGRTDHVYEEDVSQISWHEILIFILACGAVTAALIFWR